MSQTPAGPRDSRSPAVHPCPMGPRFHPGAQVELGAVAWKSLNEKRAEGPAEPLKY
jgi:hypothetical protein